MKLLKRILCLVLLLMLPATSVRAENLYQVSPASAEAFGDLLIGLARAYETRQDNSAAIAAALEAIRAADERDYAIAADIAAHWERVYLDPDYPLYCLEPGEKEASGLAGSEIPDSPEHAFVVLGFKLQNGEMTNELKGRCRAAAAAAHSFPHTLLVCSGGATGSNNPEYHTEAGLMKKFLVQRCGLTEDRILTDEKATSTLSNAANTFEILRNQGIRSITIVTSTYHQRWGQMVYLALSAVNRHTGGYAVEILENYCYPIQASETYLHDDRFAVSQIAELLGLPSKVTGRISKTLRKIK